MRGCGRPLGTDFSGDGEGGRFESAPCDSCCSRLGSPELGRELACSGASADKLLWARSVCAEPPVVELVPACTAVVPLEGCWTAACCATGSLPALAFRNLGNW